jgi:hydrogenase expression/formation protein HypD
VAEVFELRESFEWRGLGEVPASALRIPRAYAAFDAEARSAWSTGPWPTTSLRVRRHPARRQAPPDCKLFGTVCTPENPMGSCMVSEGACAAHYSYGRFRTSAGTRMSRHRPLAPSPTTCGPGFPHGRST